MQRSVKDLLAGAAFIVFGLAFAIAASRYQLGTAFRMGPGYFSVVLGGALVLLGILVVVEGFVAGEKGAIGPVPWRALVLILGAILFFGVTVRGLGLVVSLFLTVLAASFASRRTSVVAALLIAIGLTVGCVVIFVEALGLPVRLFGPWLGSERAMELLANLQLGFVTALDPYNILYCFVGVLLGTMVGVLPGIGPTATIAMLLPITFNFEPVTALIMLAGIYYGAQYGGSTTAILINLPGESSSAVTAIDGYQMARQGRAGPALATAALGSFFAGTVATFVLVLFAPPLARIALKFGPAEYFSLIVLGLIASIALAHGSVIKALAMIVLGLLFGMVGQDIYTGTPRFTFGQRELYSGLNFVSVAVGIFGVAEILRNLEDEKTRSVMVKTVTNLWLTKADFRRIIAPVLRGTLLGSILGILPGGGHILASFASYSIEKRMSRHPETFGKGAIEGVAAPESANNAAAQTSFIPLLTLGLPAHPVMALMVGAFIIQGITPGPNVIVDEPALFWGLIVSMWVGNLLLVLLNLPLIGIWVKMLTIPYNVLFPAIVAFACIGCYSLNLNAYHVYAIAFFGIVGYGLVKLGCEPAPLLLGFVLGPLLEEHLRRAMIISRGDPTVFLTRPISAVLLAMAAAALIVALLPSIRKKREEVFQEED